MIDPLNPEFFVLRLVHIRSSSPLQNLCNLPSSPLMENHCVSPLFLPSFGIEEMGHSMGKYGKALGFEKNDDFSIPFWTRSQADGALFNKFINGPLLKSNLIAINVSLLVSMGPLIGRYTICLT